MTRQSPGRRRAPSTAAGPVSGDRYVPIEEYGFIGNLETGALIAADGSVDWFPFPHVESTSIFAAILDADSGGHFRVGPTEGTEGTQRYLDGTNVLDPHMFDYARADPSFEWTTAGLQAAGPDERTTLESDFEIDLDRDSGRATGTTTLESGETEWVLLRCTGAEDANADPRRPSRTSTT